MADKAAYDEFVADRSPRLLRVAFLLTRDWGEAEDLLQTALMKARFAWARLNDAPEAYVRRIIATKALAKLRLDAHVTATDRIATASLHAAVVCEGASRHDHDR